MDSPILLELSIRLFQWPQELWKLLLALQRSFEKTMSASPRLSIPIQTKRKVKIFQQSFNVLYSFKII